MPIPFNPPDPVYPTFGQSLGQGIQQGVANYNDRLKQEEQAKLLQIQIFQYQQKQQELANTNLEQNLAFGTKNATPYTMQQLAPAFQQLAGNGTGQVDSNLMVEADRILGTQKKKLEAQATPRSARPRVNYVNADGRMVKVVSDANGATLSKEDMGSTGAFATKIADANAEFNIAMSNLDTLEDLSNGLVKAMDATGIPTQYAAKKISELAAVEGFEDAKIYLNSRDAFLSSISRASGEKGVLTDYDVERIRKALPDETDTVGTAKRKMEIARTLFENIRDARVQAYGGRDGSSPRSDKESGKAVDDAGGGKGGGAVATEPQFSRESDGIYVTPVGGKKRKAVASDFKD